MTREELDAMICTIPGPVLVRLTAFAIQTDTTRLVAAVYESALLDWLAGKRYSVKMEPTSDGVTVFAFTVVSDVVGSVVLSTLSTKPTRLAALVECVKQVAARESPR